jgi:hypothetical protein
VKFKPDGERIHSSHNVKGVARRRKDVQSEANEGRYPPLPLPSC